MGAFRTFSMAHPQTAGSAPSYNRRSSSQSSSGVLSGGKIAAIILGTILAVGVVCLLLFYPQRLFAFLINERHWNRPSRSKEVPLKDLPQRQGRASGNDGSSNGADDARGRRRHPEAIQCESTQPHRNHTMVRRPSRGPIIINNNIFLNSDDYLRPLPALDSPRRQEAVPPVVVTPRSNDYLQALPALNSPRRQDHVPPVVGISRTAQRNTEIRNPHIGSPPNGALPPQRRRRGEPPTSPLVKPTTKQTSTSSFWDVSAWARGVVPGQAPRSLTRGTAGSPTRAQEQHPVRRRDESPTRERGLHIPGAFPEDQNSIQRFHLVTAPARVRAPGAPSHGDNGFWVREARENGWRSQEREDDRRERLEREESRERREERRERERLERKDRWEREEREERRERRAREDRREWRDGIR